MGGDKNGGTNLNKWRETICPSLSLSVSVCTPHPPAVQRMNTPVHVTPAWLSARVRLASAYLRHVVLELLVVCFLSLSLSLVCCEAIANADSGGRGKMTDRRVGETPDQRLSPRRQ